MKKIIVAVIVLILVVILGFIFYRASAKPEPTIYKDLVFISTPLAEEEITSPVVIKGEARGTWYFEATFPVVLVNWNGLIIAEGYATAQNDWMTEDFVPFEAVLEFEKPEYGERGAIILQKSNPSGLSEHDDALEQTIYFK